MINFKSPMLAATLLPPDIEHTDETVLAAMKKLRYPVLASLKMDGIRAIKLDYLYSRRLKLIPNQSILNRAMKLPAGFDMELWNPALEYCEIESIVMSEEHERSEEIQFHLIDKYDCSYNYSQRLTLIAQAMNYWSEWRDVKFVYPALFQDAEALMHFEKKVIDSFGEGICFRTLNSPYKQGRSTLKEQYLVKHSRYIRSEVTVIGFEEQLCNINKEKRNAIGMMDRSSRKSGMRGKETLGAMICRLGEHVVRVGTGVGWTDTFRLDVWQNQDKYLGKQLTIKHKPCGAKIKPRHPIGVGWREEGF